MAEPSTRPIFTIRQINDLSFPQGELLATSNLTVDELNRPLHDLRISVTDRCNFRCSYCMPKDVFGKDHKFLAQEDLLSFEEITRTAKIFVSLGIVFLPLLCLGQ